MSAGVLVCSSEIGGGVIERVVHMYGGINGNFCSLVFGSTPSPSHGFTLNVFSDTPSSNWYQIFVSVFHQTGLDTRSMTRRSILVGVKGGLGRAWAEAQALLDYAGHQPT